MHQVSRRRFLEWGSTILSLSVASPVLAADMELPRRRTVPARKESSVEQWMDAWMQAPQAPGGTLHISRFKDPIYFLTKSGVGWKPNDDQKGRFQPVEVPVGFVTDFASIPRAFWSFLRPDGEYTYPAIVHDWMYWDQTRPREEADEIFKFGMQDFDIAPSTVQIIYRAVRGAGQSAWNSNAGLKAAGEKRILKEYPNDPRIPWEVWKKRSGVFV